MEEDMIYFQELIEFFKVKEAYKVDGMVEFGMEDFKKLQSLLNRLEQQNNKLEQLEKENGQLRVHYASYLQGYEDGKEHKTTATQILAENMKCELCKEHTKRNSIPKSVIRDKIKELESYKGLVMYEKYNYESTILNLEEILGDE